MDDLLTGMKSGKRGVISLVGIAVLLLGIVVGAYLVQQKQLFQPKAYSSKEEYPITAEITNAPQEEVGFTIKAPEKVQVGQTVRVSVYAHSDGNVVNLFAVKLRFPVNLLKVEGIEAEAEKSFIKNWAQKSFDNNQGLVTFIGGVPSPGVQTQSGSEGLLVAEIVFKAKSQGLVNLTLGDSAIYKNTDNSNILTTKRETSFEVKE